MFRRAVRSTARNGIRLCRGGSPFSVGSGCRIGPDRAKSEACDAKRALFCSLHRVTQNPAYERFGFASSLFFPGLRFVRPGRTTRAGTGLRRDIKSILNVLVLLGSIVVIVSLSLEVFHGAAESYYRLYMRVQFWVCIVFLVDFFYRFFLSRRKLEVFFRQPDFLLVSIPYLNIVDAFHLSLSAEAYYLIRLMPLVRGGYGLAIMVGWIARNG